MSRADLPAESLEAAETRRHRRHARLKTRAMARLGLPDGRSLLCEIRDFSLKGMLLASQDAGALQGLAAKPSITVEFPVDGQGSGRYTLPGVLVHNSEAGLGVRLDDLGNEAYQELVAARANLTRPAPPPAGLLPEEGQAILHDSVQLFQNFLDQCWRDFLEAVEGKLNRRDTATLPLADHSHYLGALASLLQHGDQLGRQHGAALLRAMQHLDVPHKGAGRPADSGSELAIVDDSSFDDWLNIANVYNRIEADNRPAMFQFAQRFSRLTPVPIDRHNDPYGPESVCLAFQDVIEGYDLNIEMRGLLYRTFGDALASRYGALYELLNQLLAPLKPARQERPQPAAEPQRDTAVAETEAAEGPIGEIKAQVNKLAEIAERLFEFAPSSQTPAAAPPAAVPEAATLQALSHTLSQLAARSPDRQPATAAPLLSAGAEVATTLDDLLAEAPTAATVSQQVTALLGQAPPAGLSESHRGRLGMTASLMNQAMTEHAERSDLDGLLKKLEKPLYEMVLRGEDPLNQADHPLRRLLNLIDRFAIVTDDDGKFIDRELGDLLGTVIDHAVENHPGQPDSFDHACGALEKLLKFPRQHHRQRVAELQEFCEVQEHIRNAKQAVARRLDEHLSGRRLPRMALNLLDQGLRQHMVLSTLRGDADECQASQDLVEALLRRDEVALPGDWLDAVETRLRGANINGQDIDACLADLESLLGQPGPVDSVDLPDGWFAKEASPAAGDGEAPADPPTRLGEWWEFDHDGRNQPMQLVWIGRPAEAYGFVNRAATRHVRLSRAELARRQAAGRLRRGEDRDLPLLERAEYGTVDNLYRRLAHRAHHDPATGLLNRKGLAYLAARQPNRSGKGHTVCLLEFLPYRAIVDTCGIEAGERLGAELAALVQHRLGPSGSLASVGDGRLALLLPDLDVAGARKIANSLVQAMHGYQFRHGQSQYAVEVRIGLAGLMPGLTDPAEALRRANAACAAAAQEGGQPVQSYEDSGDQLREQESLHAWGQRIDGLLSGHGLFLRCQQIAPLREGTGVLPYYEILLGVRDDTGTVVSPQPFVEAVEYWKRNHDLDLWVIEQTFAWIRANPAAFAATGGFSVNLSALSLADADVLAALHRHLAAGDIEPGKIVLEITETATMGNYDAAREFIRQIRHYGCRFSIDDFGSGNASYGYLRNLRTDALKIDGAFVKDMVDDPDLRAMVKSMNDIGHSLGMKTVAEFVASPEILALVREIGVDYGQGFEIARPIHIDELAAL